jgi:hypothetical protein
MDEAQIQAKLQANIPQPEAFTPAPVIVEPTDTTAIAPQTELDELTQFKIHDYFGERFTVSSTESKEKVQFIFDHIAQQIGTRDYLSVLNRVNDLEQMIGSRHADNRLQRLYQWVGLDRVRQQTENAMRLLHV